MRKLKLAVPPAGTFTLTTSLTGPWATGPATVYEMGKPVLQLFLFFLIGIYGGLIQAGAGYLVIFALSVVGGMSLKRTNSIKVIVISFYLAPSLLIYSLNGRVQWLPAVILAAGTGIGGWLGSNFCVRRGEGWIRLILAVAILAMAGRLVGLF